MSRARQQPSPPTHHSTVHPNGWFLGLIAQLSRTPANQLTAAHMTEVCHMLADRAARGLPRWTRARLRTTAESLLKSRCLPDDQPADPNWAVSVLREHGRELMRESRSRRAAR